MSDTQKLSNMCMLNGKKLSSSDLLLTDSIGVRSDPNIPFWTRCCFLLPLPTVGKFVRFWLSTSEMEPHGILPETLTHHSLSSLIPPTYPISCGSTRSPSQFSTPPHLPDSPGLYKYPARVPQYPFPLPGSSPVLLHLAPSPALAARLPATKAGHVSLRVLTLSLSSCSYAVGRKDLPSTLLCQTFWLAVSLS